MLIKKGCGFNFFLTRPVLTSYTSKKDKYKKDGLFYAGSVYFDKIHSLALPKLSLAWPCYYMIFRKNIWTYHLNTSSKIDMKGLVFFRHVFFGYFYFENQSTLTHLKMFFQ